MSFIEYPYYVGLCCIILLTLFTPMKNRWAILLFSSILFYSYGRWEYLLLLCTSISIDYLCALGIGRSELLARRRVLLFISVLSNLGILFFFKYFVGLYSSWSWLESHAGVLDIQMGSILLPLGISFYTLQSMGYTIDVYRKEIQPENHFGYFSLYVCFFPQLVAGPIERSKKLLPQLRNPQPITLDNLQSGTFLIGFGLFKKLIVSDRLFLIIEGQLSSADHLAGWQIMSLGTTIFFAIYLDISAYTDIARGSARLFGIDLSKNFNRPMLALSTTEFWQRWHITLSSWMMRYLYKPFVELSRSKTYRHRTLVFTFLVIGLWHGPTLPFILMGLLQGVVIVLEHLLISYRWPKTKLFNAMRLLRVHLVISLSGILFVSPDMHTVRALLQNIFEFNTFLSDESFLSATGGGYSFSLLLGGALVIYITNHIHESPNNILHRLTIRYQWLRTFLTYLLFTIAIACAERKSGDFLYFFF